MRTMLSYIQRVLCALFILLCVIPLLAPTSNTTFLVSATVLTNCIVIATPLAFANYDPTNAAPTTATSTVTATCTLSAPYNIGLNAGTGSGATVTTRKMTRTVGGTETLNYSLYQDAGHTTVWGNTVGTDTVSGNGTAIPQVITVYGQIPINQAAPAAVYNDTITATITY